MLCDKCGKNNATTHIKRVVNGVVTEQHLCGYCAAKDGYNGISDTGLAGMLASMFGDIVSAGNINNTVRCPVCGSAFSDIAESGKVGCAECYKTFYEELAPYLKRVHGSIKHTGKIPNSAPLAVKPNDEDISSLRMELNRLVSEEKYEDAAVVRDKIKRIEGKDNE